MSNLSSLFDRYKALVIFDTETSGLNPADDQIIELAELRERVEEYLGRWIPDSLWERSEPYARRKLDLCRERNPEIDYYNDEYLVLLTADTVRETAFSDFTIAACEALMTARGQ